MPPGVPRRRGGLVTFVTYRRPSPPRFSGIAAFSSRSSPVTSSKAPCRVRPSVTAKSTTFATREEGRRGSPYSFVLVVIIVVLVARITITGVKYWLSLKIQTRLQTPPLSAADLFMGHKASATGCRVIVPKDPYFLSHPSSGPSPAGSGGARETITDSSRFHCFRQLIKPVDASTRLRERSACLSVCLNYSHHLFTFTFAGSIVGANAKHRCNWNTIEKINWRDPEMLRFNFYRSRTIPRYYYEDYYEESFSHKRISQIEIINVL